MHSARRMWRGVWCAKVSPCVLSVRGHSVGILMKNKRALSSSNDSVANALVRGRILVAYMDSGELRAGRLLCALSVPDTGGSDGWAETKESRSLDMCAYIVSHFLMLSQHTRSHANITRKASTQTNIHSHRCRRLMPVRGHCVSSASFDQNGCANGYI